MKGTQKISDVDKIKSFIALKVENLKQQIAEYETPIMQELVKASPHMQLDILIKKAELRANEENLMAIETFCPSPGTTKEKKKK